MIGGEDLDPTFIPADVPGPVEVHQYNYEEHPVSDAPLKKKENAKSELEEKVPSLY